VVTVSNDAAANSADQLQEGDTVTVELEGEVVDEMENHDGVFRIDVQSQQVEILHDEIIDIEQPARAVDKQERSGDTITDQGDDLVTDGGSVRTDSDDELDIEAILDELESFEDVNLREALQIEVEIAEEFEHCPDCGELFQEVALSNGGKATFVHDSGGMLISGCEFELADILDDCSVDTETDSPGGHDEQ